MKLKRTFPSMAKKCKEKGDIIKKKGKMHHAYKLLRYEHTQTHIHTSIEILFFFCFFLISKFIHSFIIKSPSFGLVFSFSLVTSTH